LGNQSILSESVVSQSAIQNNLRDRKRKLISQVDNLAEKPSGGENMSHFRRDNPEISDFGGSMYSVSQQRREF
jgi:hypothetical protein